MIALLFPWYQYAIAWFSFFMIGGALALSVYRAVSGATSLFKREPNVDADVRVLFAENVNMNQDPTKPEDRYAAVNEYQQQRRARR
jgi:hypothetical protein